MVRYAQNELFSVTDFAKQLGSVIKDIKEHTIEKIGVLKNNKLEAVVISTTEYERLKNYEDMIESMEHKEISNIIQDRNKTPKSEYISIEDMAKTFDIDLNTL
jgi:PHD/YefM family antitoxin component YafN of YafNO toxin-antitoxin module